MHEQYLAYFPFEEQKIASVLLQAYILLGFVFVLRDLDFWGRLASLNKSITMQSREGAKSLFK